MKRPAFQFYPGDWQRDAALRCCSVAARGLWIEMMCVMHQADPYGVLVLNGKPIDEFQLSRMVGATEREVSRWLQELESAGVYSRDEQNRIYSRRMVRDEHLRTIRAESGKLGGNPALLGNKVNQMPTIPDKKNSTPSSSSSSSSSIQNQGRRSARKANGQTADWCKTEQGIDAKGKELGIPSRAGETYPQYKRRLFAAIEGRPHDPT